MDSSGMTSSAGSSAGVKRGWDQSATNDNSSGNATSESAMPPPEKKPATADLVAQAAAAAAAAAARVTANVQRPPQSLAQPPPPPPPPAQHVPPPPPAQHVPPPPPAQQVPAPPVPMTPPARLDITPEGEKGSASAYGAVIASSIPEEFVREVKCPQSVMGRVIGPRGATINQLQTTTLCKIQCQPGKPGGFARVKISGPTQTCVDGAVIYVQAMVGNWDDYTDEQLIAAGGKEIRKEIVIPHIHVGSVIGPKGSVIKTIEADTGAKLEVDNRSSRGSKEDRHMTISGPEQAVEKAAQYVMSVMAGTYDINQAVLRMTALDNSTGAYFSAQAQQLGNAQQQQQQAWANAQYLRWPAEQAIAQAAYNQVMADLAAGKSAQSPGAPLTPATGSATVAAASPATPAAVTQTPAMDPATLKQWKDYIGQCNKAIADAPKERRKEMKDYVENLKRQYGLTDEMLGGAIEVAEEKEAAPEEPAPVDRRLASVGKSTAAEQQPTD
ncbi:hypothetical protein FOZ60_007962 [Perkinsus olseni]|uniref:K Homology domain-containing protein n=1 Tax=Perkinsus olseni TaxID=32597 RepID=A0A7J6NKI6_PEROL|nr:hypothetical protein FOZ60_007962 [Perkinsus olseni]